MSLLRIMVWMQLTIGCAAVSFHSCAMVRPQLVALSRHSACPTVLLTSHRPAEKSAAMAQPPCGSGHAEEGLLQPCAGYILTNGVLAGTQRRTPLSLQGLYTYPMTQRRYGQAPGCHFAACPSWQTMSAFLTQEASSPCMSADRSRSSSGRLCG